MLGGQQGPGPDQGREQALAADRLEQVVEGIDLEGVDREFVEGRDEDHQRHRLRIGAVALACPCGDVARQFDPGHARHLDVHQHDLRALRLDLGERLGRIRGLTDDAVWEIGSQIGQDLAQAGPRRRLVINDQDGCGGV